MMTTSMTREIAGKTVQVNEEGFMTNPGEWSREMAGALASEEGITVLTPGHWKVIDFCRQSASGGKSPTLRQITSGTGITTREMFALFPKGPAKKVARISGTESGTDRHIASGAMKRS